MSETRLSFREEGRRHQLPRGAARAEIFAREPIEAQGP
jgi:hypothetical protein